MDYSTNAQSVKLDFNLENYKKNSKFNLFMKGANSNMNTITSNNKFEEVRKYSSNIEDRNIQIERVEKNNSHFDAKKRSTNFLKIQSKKKKALN